MLFSFEPFSLETAAIVPRFVCPAAARTPTVQIRRVCRKSPVGAVVFLRYFPLCVSSSLVTSDSRGNGLECRSTGEEPHQPLEVLHGCRKIELLAYEAHPA